MQVWVRMRVTEGYVGVLSNSETELHDDGSWLDSIAIAKETRFNVAPGSDQRIDQIISTEVVGTPHLQ